MQRTQDVSETLMDEKEALQLEKKLTNILQTEISLTKILQREKEKN